MWHFWKQIRCKTYLAPPPVRTARHSKRSQKSTELADERLGYHDSTMRQRKHANQKTATILKNACEFVTPRTLGKETRNSFQPLEQNLLEWAMLIHRDPQFISIPCPPQFKKEKRVAKLKYCTHLLQTVWEQKTFSTLWLPIICCPTTTNLGADNLHLDPLGHMVARVIAIEFIKTELITSQIVLNLRWTRITKWDIISQTLINNHLPKDRKCIWTIVQEYRDYK